MVVILCSWESSSSGALGGVVAAVTGVCRTLAPQREGARGVLRCFGSLPRPRPVEPDLWTPRADCGVDPAPAPKDKRLPPLPYIILDVNGSEDEEQVS